MADLDNLTTSQFLPVDIFLHSRRFRDGGNGNKDKEAKELVSLLSETQRLGGNPIPISDV